MKKVKAMESYVSAIPLPAVRNWNLMWKARERRGLETVFFFS